MKILIACEYSRTVWTAFTALGHECTSCDLLDADVPGPRHYKGDVMDIINDGWDMMVAHPPCTFLTNSAAWCYSDNPTIRQKDGTLKPRKMKPGTIYGSARIAERERALNFVRALWSANIPKVVIENPQGCINTRIAEMPRPQVVQPYEYGHDASKQTCLWMRGLPELKPTKFVEPRMVCKACKTTTVYGAKSCPQCGGEEGLLMPRWANQTDSGQNVEPPADDRWKTRSDTFEGIAAAMAQQWGNS